MKVKIILFNILFLIFSQNVFSSQNIEPEEISSIYAIVQELDQYKELLSSLNSLGYNISEIQGIYYLPRIYPIYEGELWIFIEKQEDSSRSVPLALIVTFHINFENNNENRFKIYIKEDWLN